MFGGGGLNVMEGLAELKTVARIKHLRHSGPGRNSNVFSIIFRVLLMKFLLFYVVPVSEMIEINDSNTPITCILHCLNSNRRYLELSKTQSRLLRKQSHRV